MANDLGVRYPGGCFIGFNASVNQKGVEQLVSVSAMALQNQFRSLTISMSSIGGDPESAYYAYNTLSALPIKVVTHNTGNVMSAALTVFLAGHERYASPNAPFLVHETAFNYESGNRLTTSFVAQKVKQICGPNDERTAQIIAEKTGRPIESVYEWQKGERAVRDVEAIEWGLISAVRPFVIPADGWFVQVVT